MSKFTEYIEYIGLLFQTDADFSWDYKCLNDILINLNNYVCGAQKNTINETGLVFLIELVKIKPKINNILFDIASFAQGVILGPALLKVDTAEACYATLQSNIILCAGRINVSIFERFINHSN